MGPRAKMYGNVQCHTCNVVKKLCNIMYTIVDEVASYCNDSGVAIGEIDFMNIHVIQL